ncbi:MAG: TolC family protein, partial [Paraglaciecola sp.]|nr:TolC family protein [Paraglaciecola sp.]
MKLTPPLLIVVLLSGCVTTSQVDNNIRGAAVPQSWQFSETTKPVTGNWFAQFNEPALALLVNEALDNNQTLRQEAYN